MRPLKTNSDRDSVSEFYTSTRLFFGEIQWVIKSKKPVNTAFHELSTKLIRDPACANALAGEECGGEENRTPVQTYPSKAFYMLIC